MARFQHSHALGRAIASVAASVVLTALATDASAASGALIYVNRCASSCTVMSGADDAVNGKSSIISGTKVLSAFAQGDAVFSDTVTCLRSVFARYDVQIVTTNPGTARREMMLAGNATQLGFPSGSGGVAPAGAIKDNAIAFTFANDIGADPDTLCWVAAAQLGALYALEPEYRCQDIMGYAAGCGLKTFSDFAAPCGTFAPVATCPYSGQPTQNSDALMTARAGLSDRLFLNEFETPRPSPPAI